jgi:hypothetical protein
MVEEQKMVTSGATFPVSPERHEVIHDKPRLNSRVALDSIFGSRHAVKVSKLLTAASIE